MLHYSDMWTMIYKSKASYTIAVKRTRNWTGFPTTVHIQGVSYTGHVKAMKKMRKTTPETTCKSIKRHKDSNNNNILSVNCTQHVHFLYQTKTCHRHLTPEATARSSTENYNTELSHQIPYKQSPETVEMCNFQLFRITWFPTFVNTLKKKHNELQTTVCFSR